MSESARGSVASSEHNEVGPNYFGFYTHEVEELFSQDDDSLPFSSQSSELSGEVRDMDIAEHSNNGIKASSLTSSGPLFSAGVGAGLSYFRKERLKGLLRQSVIILTREVDEMLDPVVAIRRLQFHLKDKNRPSSYSGATSDGDAGLFPCKKLKISSSASSTGIPVHASPVSCGSSREGSGSEHLNSKLTSLEKRKSSVVQKTCVHCHSTKTSKWRTGPEGQSLCNACGIKLKKERMSLSTKEEERESLLGSRIGAGDENEGSGSEHINSKLTLSEKRKSSVVQRTCGHCHSTETSMWITGPEGQSLCNAFGIKLKNERMSLSTKDEERESLLGSRIGAGKGNEGSGSERINSKLTLSEKRKSSVVQRTCGHCHSTETSLWRTGPEGQCLCNACGIKLKKERMSLSTKDEERESLLGSRIGAGKENEVSDDLQFLLENDSLQVEEMMKKYSDELSATLGNMERQLEELLDTMTAKCRPMTLTEKQKLRNLIQDLPPKNLDRVVEIIRRGKMSETHSHDEIHVDLEEEDNITLWRLYYYVKAVENARKLSMSLKLNKALL